MKAWRFPLPVLFLLVAVTVLFWLASPPAEAGAAPLAEVEAAGLSVQPVNQTVQVGDIFTVTLNLAAVDAPLSAFQFDLAYHSGRIAFQQASPAAFLRATGRSLNCPAPTFPTTNSLRFVCATAGDPAGVTGSGALVTFTFKAVGQGISPLNLSAVLLAGDSVPPSALPTGSQQNGQVTVGSPTAVTIEGTETDLLFPAGRFLWPVVLLGLVVLASVRVYRRRGGRHLISFLVVLGLLLGSWPASPVAADSIAVEDPAGLGDLWGLSNPTDTRLAPAAPLACYPTNFDCDSDVDEGDLSAVAAVWDCALGEACYLAAYDLDGNGVINAYDLAWVGNDYDITPPQITLTSPTAWQVFTGATSAVAGSISDDHALSNLNINGAAVPLAGNSFNANLPLSNGNQVVNVTVNDALGQTGFTSQVALVDNEGPMVAIEEPAGNQAIYSFYPNAQVQYTDFYTNVDKTTFNALLMDEQGVTTDVTANFTTADDSASGYLGGPLSADSVYTLTVTIADLYGNVGGDTIRFYVPAGADTIYPPSVFGETAWVSGFVYDSSTCNEHLTTCRGMAGVHVTAATIDPESRDTNSIYGEIVTGPDGFFAYPYYNTDFLTVRFEKEGYTYGQREVAVVRGRSTATSAIYLTPLDPAVTPCDTNGCSHISSDGVLKVEIPAGAIIPGQSVNVQATSFDRVNFLPGGELPPDTAETYAFNLSGESEIQFAVPVTVSIQNYRGFDPGDQIPLGFWNPETLQWEHVGVGEVDPTGEWVVMHVTHFSMYDCNDPIFPPSFGSTGDDETEPDSCPVGGPGCFIHYKSGIVEDSIKEIPAVNVLGEWTAPSFNYNTERANPSAVIDIKLGALYTPSSVYLSPHIQFEVYIEGKKTDRFTFAAPISGSGEIGRYRYLWDGRNGLGEALPPGAYEFAIRATYSYTGYFCYGYYDRFGIPVPDCLFGRTRTVTTGNVDQWVHGTVELNTPADNPFGAGWLLDGQQRLYEDEAGRVMVADSDNLTEFYFGLADELGGRGQYFTGRPPVIGPAAALDFTPPPGSGTFVSGTISADTTWTTAGSPYKVVEGSLTVADGATLTIDPGVEVLFGQYRKLTVEGALEAVGTPAQPITFTLYGQGEVDSWLPLTVTNSLANNIVSDVSAVEITANGDVYFSGSTSGYAGGATLDRLLADGVTWQSLAYPAELGYSPRINEITQDAAGNLWFATGGNGVGVLDPANTTWTVYNVDNSELAHDTVQDIAVDSGGDVWMGLYYSGVSRFTPASGTWITYTTADGLASDQVYSVAVDEDDNVWFGTAAGLNRRTPAGVWTTYDRDNSGILDNQIYDIAFDGDGAAWLAVAFVGVSVLDSGGGWTNYTPDNSGLDNDNITSILIDSLGRKWFGHPGEGVSLLLEGNQVWSHEERPRLSSNVVNDLAQAPNGDIWLANGYDGGGGGDASPIEAADGNGGATRVRRTLLIGSSVQPGFWGALQIGGGSTLSDSDSSQLSYVTIAGGGFGAPAALYLYNTTPAALDHLLIYGSGGDGVYALNSDGLVMDTAVLEANEGDGLSLIGGPGGHSLTNLTIRYNSGTGLRFDHVGTLDISDSSINNNRDYGLYTDARDTVMTLTDSLVQNNRVAARLPANSSFDNVNWSGNRRNEIEWSGGTLIQPATWEQQPGGISLYRLTGVITVTDGLTLTLQPGLKIVRDNAGSLLLYGGLDAVGTAESVIYFGPGNSGYFGELVLGRGSVSGDSNGSRLRYVVFDTGHLFLDETSPAVFDHLSFLNDYYGLYVHNSPGVSISDSNFIANYGGAIINDTPGLTVTATMNYWNASNGPYHPTLNPAGQGHYVSDGVLFDPWSGPIRMDGFNPILVGRSPADHSMLTYNPTSGGYTRIYPDGREVIFDYSGYHSETRWPDGRRALFAYNYDGTLASWSIAAPGEETPDWVWTFNYDLNGKLTSLTDPAGRTSNFTINQHGHLTQISYPDGRSDNFYYDERGLLTQRQERDGGISSYGYDVYGRLISHIGPLRPVYDPATGTISVTQEVQTLTPSDTAYPLINASSVGDPDNPAPAAPQSADLVDQITYERGTVSGHTNRWGAWLDQTDGEGRTTTYSYNEANHPTLTTLADGNCVSYSYDEMGNRLRETHLPAGQCTSSGGGALLSPSAITQTWSSTFEARYNQIKTETDPLGRTTTYVYDYEVGAGEAGKLVQVIYPPVENENGVVVTPVINYSYNVWGQLETQSDARGAVTRYVYTQGTPDEADGGSNPLFAPGVSPVPGLLTQKIEDDGGVNQTITYKAFDAAGNPGLVIGVGGSRPTLYNYNSMNWVVSETDAAGIVTTYEHDGRGNTVRKVKDYTADGVSGRNVVTSYSYDHDDRQLSQRTAADGLLVEESNGYDVNGLLAARTDGRGNTTRWFYDNANQEIAQIDAAGEVISKTYTLDGQLEQMIDQDGYIRLYEYDGLNRLVTETVDLAGLNLVTLHSYDLFGNQVTTTAADGTVTCFDYNSHNRLISESRDCGGLNLTTGYAYDLNGNQVYVTDQRGIVTYYGYDALNRLITWRQDDGGLDRSSTMVYDPAGNLVQQSDWRGVINESSYDLLNRLTGVCEDAAGLNLCQSYGYDRLDYRRVMTDANGIVTEYENNAWGLPLSVSEDTTGLYAVTLYEYDNALNRVGITDANGNRTGYVYSPRNEIAARDYADGTVVSDSYDGRGNLSLRTHQDGETTGESYNGAGWLEQRTFSSGGSQSFQYDRIGRVTLAAENLNGHSSQIAYAYNAVGEVISSTQTLDGLGWTVGYEYDYASGTYSTTYPSGLVVGWQSDPLNRLDKVQRGDGSLVGDYSYHDLSSFWTLVQGNGLVSRFDYDSLRRTTRISSSLADYRYGYDGGQQRLYRQRFDRPGQPAEVYQYDGLYQVTAAWYGANATTPAAITSYDRQQQFSLDNVHNRLVVYNNGTPQSYGPHNGEHLTDPMNRYEQVDAATYEYDERGNSIADGTNSYSYDLLNRQIGISGPSLTAEYVYSALGPRLAKTVNGVTSHYVYDLHHRVIEERAGDGSLVARTIYGSGPDEVLAMERGGATYYYQRDAQDSITEVSDAAGSLVEQYSYDVYGTPFIFDSAGAPLMASAVGNPYLYTGRIYDPESGHYDFRARTYAPGLGRFLQMDPLEYVDGMNLYASYFAVNATDPTGRKQLLAKRTVYPPNPKGGYCGYFDWRIQWVLEEPAGKSGGYIIQGVSIQSSITDCKGNQVNGPRVTYQEAWEVTANSKTMVPADHDTYRNPTSYWKTKGTIRYIGSASYYDGITLPTDFVIKNPNTGAGILWSTTTYHKFANGTTPVVHSLFATWDCCCNPTDKTQITTN